jgi:hypothetical protein
VVCEICGAPRRAVGSDDVEAVALREHAAGEPRPPTPPPPRARPPLHGASVALLGDGVLDNLLVLPGDTPGGRRALTVVDHVLLRLDGAFVSNFAACDFRCEDVLTGGMARASRGAREARGDPLPSHVGRVGGGGGGGGGGAAAAPPGEDPSFFQPLRALAELSAHTEPGRPFIVVLSVGFGELFAAAVGGDAGAVRGAVAATRAAVGRTLDALLGVQPRAPRVVLLLPPLPPPGAPLGDALREQPPPRDWDEERAPPPAALFAALVEEAFAPALERAAAAGAAGGAAGVAAVLDVPRSLAHDDGALWAAPGAPSAAGGERLSRLIADACARIAGGGGAPGAPLLLRLLGAEGGGGVECLPLRGALPWRVFPAPTLGARLWGGCPVPSTPHFEALIPAPGSVSVDVVVPARGGRGALQLGSIGAAQDAFRARSVGLIVQCAKEFAGAVGGEGAGGGGGGGGGGAPPPGPRSPEEVRAARLRALAPGAAAAAFAPRPRVFEAGFEDSGALEQDVDAVLDRALPEIEAARRAGVDVLVNCRAGMSRSAAVVVAHLVEGAEGLPLRDALLLVRAARPIAFIPNLVFLCRLRAREARRAGACTVPLDALLDAPLLQPPAVASPAEAREQLALAHAGTWGGRTVPPPLTLPPLPLPPRAPTAGGFTLVQAAAGARGPLLLGGVVAGGEGGAAAAAAAAAVDAAAQGAATLVLLYRGGGAPPPPPAGGAAAGVEFVAVGASPLCGEPLRAAAAAVTARRGGGVALACAEGGLEEAAATVALAHLVARAPGRAPLSLLSAWRLLAACGRADAAHPSPQGAMELLGAHHRAELAAAERAVPKAGHPLAPTLEQLVAGKPFFEGAPRSVARAMVLRWMQELVAAQ